MEYILQIMRNRIQLFLPLFAICISSSAQFTSPESRWKFYLDICEKYSPDAGEILNSFEYWKPYADYAKWADTPEELINESHTVVHEGCHGYNSRIAQLGSTGDGYYIAPGISISVQAGPTYNSNELNRMVPDSLEKKIFRYGTYVGETSGVSSQVTGIYGLLDEFSAYYHATKFAYDLRPWFENEYGFSDASPWVDTYIWSVGSSATAFYEFRLFMAWYLKYAKANRPQVYKSIMQNTNLRLSFTLLYDLFENAAEAYEMEVERVVSDLSENGFEVKLEEEFVMMYHEDGGYGKGHYLKDIRFLRKLFTADLQHELNQLRLPGANLENYQDHMASVSEE